MYTNAKTLFLTLRHINLLNNISKILEKYLFKNNIC